MFREYSHVGKTCFVFGEQILSDHKKIIYMVIIRVVPYYSSMAFLQTALEGTRKHSSRDYQVKVTGNE